VPTIFDHTEEAENRKSRGGHV